MIAGSKNYNSFFHFMSRKLRVLECIRQGQIGGGESHLLSLVENLDRSQFEPIVLSFTDGPMIDRLKTMGVETHIIHTLKPFDFRKWGQVKQLLKEKNIDFIHAHGTRASSNVLWAARSLGIPVIYTVHGWSFHPDQKPLIKKIRILGEKYITSRTDLNISVSASNQQTGRDFISSFNSIVVNNGIDQQKFNPAKPYKDIRTELSIPKDVLLVLFIARFTSHKQPLKLIEAFGQALPSNPHMYLLMVGDGDQKEEAVALIERLRLKDKIKLESFRQDVPDVLNAADIFVLPSLWEGLPIGLLEAMAMGKAVIASNVDGTSEVIQHDQNGWLVETEGLVSNLSNALVQLGTDETKRKRYQYAALQTVNEKYNAANMTRTIEDLYRQVLQKKGPVKKQKAAAV
jgi:glycosyltransferase involved in cell wall biosynthesis